MENSLPPSASASSIATSPYSYCFDDSSRRRVASDRRLPSSPYYDNNYYHPDYNIDENESVISDHSDHRTYRNNKNKYHNNNNLADLIEIPSISNRRVSPPFAGFELESPPKRDSENYRNSRVSYFDQSTLPRPSNSNSSAITNQFASSTSMAVSNAYKIGFWLLTALLIVVGAVVIGLLGAGKLSFGGTERPSRSSFDLLQKHGAQFYLLQFNDVSVLATTSSDVRRTAPQYLQRMEWYLNDVEKSLQTPPLADLLRVDILNIQKNDSASAITVTALLAFDGGSTNETLSEELILQILEKTRNPRNSNWRDAHVNELKDMILPSITPDTSTTPVPRSTTTVRPPRPPAPVAPVGGRCDHELIDYCVGVTDPKRVFYPNALGHENAREVKAALGLFQMLDHNQCHPTVRNFTCLLLQPPCAAEGTEFKAFLPCATYCRDVVASCQPLLNGTYLEQAATRCDSLPLVNCTQICLDEHFVCEKSKLCLNNASRCDHKFDCGPGDYSDEKDCGCKDPNQRQCPSGQCLSKSLFCNNRNDCGDWGDEIDCKCPDGHRKCDTTGQCFPERFWCNDEFDCDDKSDEKNCSCTASDFKCQNGFCLHPEVRCDGANDCEDFSDEFNCECTDYQFKCDKYLCKNYINTWCNRRPDCDDGSDEPANCTCKDYQFRCDNGQCIPIYEKCDGKPQCDDNSDELHCECTKHQFKCANGQCIASEMVCDGKFQCADGSDERQNCTCEKGKFPCQDGACMPITWWCDGNKECKNGEDEIADCKHTCPPDHPLKCTSWRKGKSVCVHKLQLCNGHVMCKNGEDEHDCDCDPAQSFTCPGGNQNNTVCLPWSKYCDGVQDCPYVSEEINCACNTSHQFECPTVGNNGTKCISLRQQCDGIVHCANGEDERNCTCGDILQNRSPHRLCDGVPDCPDFSDEFHETCERCNASTHYLCPNGNECILQLAVCDGVKDCSGGDDEKFCLKLADTEAELSKPWEINPSGVLYGRRKGQWAPVCGQDLQDRRTLESICSHFGYEGLRRSNKVKRENSTFDYIKLPTGFEPDKPIGQKIGLPSPIACPSEEAVRLSCDANKIRCGRRPLVDENSTARIAGGKESKYGSWPSFAALYQNGRLHCGATIVDRNWVLTAAHCVFEERDTPERSDPTPSNATIDDDHHRRKRHAPTIAGHWEGYRIRPLGTLTIRAGVLRNSARSPYDQFRTIDAALPHSMFSPKTGRIDIALLRLQSPLAYSAYVWPSCVAEQRATLPRGEQRKCVAMGYGSLGSGTAPQSDELMEVELPAKETEECRKLPTINVDQRIERTQICAGEMDGSKDTCQGDSGGPLQCRICTDAQKGQCSWSLYGITSAGYSCGSLMTPGVYTKVGEFDDWVHAVIHNFKDTPRNHTCSDGAQFACLLGNCIPDNKVCDRNWDCLFGEDEEKCGV